MVKPPRRLLAAVFAAALAVGPIAVAQTQYDLTESDIWEQRPGPKPGTPEGKLENARVALANGQDDRAEFLATQWIDRYPDNPSLPDAYLIRGDALRARGSYYNALFDYEYVARSFPGSEAFVRALEREFEIAELFATGTRRRFLGIRMINAKDEAEELLIRIQERLPGSELAERAGLALGDFYFDRRDMELAADMYALFIENYPRSRHIRRVRKRLIYAYLAAFKGPEFDASGLEEARTRLQRLEVVDPVTAEQMGAESLITRIDESEARKMLTTASWYLKTGDLISAELTVRRLIFRFPRSVAASRAIRRMPEYLSRLPASVLADAPDYAALYAALVDGAPLPESAPDILGRPRQVPPGEGGRPRLQEGGS